MKRIFTFFAAAIVAVAMYAQSPVGGSCGANSEWYFDPSRGLLSISGAGAMDDYSSGAAPWYKYNQEITRLAILDGVPYIGDYAFWGLLNVTDVTIPGSVKNIGDYAFASCGGLRTLRIENGVQYIGKGAFGLCLALETVMIPNTVTTIDELAFGLCGNLKIVSIPASVTTLGKQALAFCPSLQWIINAAGIPQTPPEGLFDNVDKTKCRLSVLASAEQAFRATAEWKEFNIEPVQATAMGLCGENLLWTYDAGTNAMEISGTGRIYDFFEEWDEFKKDIETLELQEGVSTIGRDAFRNCFSLTSVVLPASLDSVDQYPFSSCNQLTSIEVAEGNYCYSSVDGVLFNKTKTYLIKYPAAKPEEEYCIPNTVTDVQPYAFCDSRRLNKLTIPSSVVTIDQLAFGYCSSLHEIYNYAAPILIEASVFRGVDQPNCILYVPQQYYQQYKTEEVWKDFNVQITDRGEAIDQTPSGSPSRGEKVLRDGLLFIERNGKTYNAQGAEVR